MFIHCKAKCLLTSPLKYFGTCFKIQSQVNSKTPVTLGRRSHGDLDRHQIAVQNAGNAVGAPLHRHETPWKQLERRGTAFVFCCKLQTPWDRRPLKNALGTPYNRRDNAVQSPRTSWQRSEVALGTSRWPTAIAQAIVRRLHRDYIAFTGLSWRYQSFALRLHGVFKAIAQRSRGVHGDSKAIALPPHGVFTAIAASPFK
jgi:hypothetical protein